MIMVLKIPPIFGIFLKGRVREGTTDTITTGIAVVVEAMPFQGRLKMKGTVLSGLACWQDAI